MSSSEDVRFFHVWDTVHTPRLYAKLHLICGGDCIFATQNASSVQTPCTYPADTDVPQRGRGDHWSSENVSLSPSLWLPRFCEHIFLNIVHYSAFSRKRRNQKCLHCIPLRGNRRVLTHSRASDAGLLPRAEVVGALPGFRCPNPSRGSLRLFAASSPSRNVDLRWAIVFLPHPRDRTSGM